MVRSGLTDRVSVNEFWLAGHLIFALIIFSLILYQGLKAKYNPQIADKCDNRREVVFLKFLTFFITSLQIFFGGLVAGLHILHMCYKNCDSICKFEFLDVVRYQDSIPFLYFHKLFAFIVFFGILIAFFSVLRTQVVLKYLLLFLVVLQIALGISVLFVSPGSELTNHIAVSHQINGILVYTTLFVGYFKVKYKV
jgi:heme A synthase